MFRLMASCLVLLLVAMVATAHDFWLQPATFTPVPKANTAIALHVGDGFVSDGERAWTKTGLTSFLLVGAKAKTDLVPLGKEGDKPFGNFVCPEPGSFVLVMEREPRLITLEAKKFLSYLTTEGLTTVIAERKKRGEADKPGRERYGRSLKTYVRVGDKGDETWKKTFGHPLELVPLADPTGLKKGDVMRFRVLFDGKALAGASVACHSKEAPVRHGQTDKAGEVGFEMKQAGMHLVRLVWMTRAEKDKEADWVSWWAASTFAVR